MSNDRIHFEEYREQTRVKHEILEKYLRAYLHVLKSWNNNLLFIDGFAGPGVYQANGSTQPGSPIRALSLIASDSELAKRVTTVFIERDKLLYESLEKEVLSFYGINPEIRMPIYLNNEFRQGMEIVLKPFETKGKSLAPTFLFVDPCGVNGVYFDTLARLMNFGSCEIFLFFNIDGLRRILGLGEARGDTLAQFFGSDNEAEDLLKVIEGKSSSEKEDLIIGRYYDIVKRDIGANYISGFRIEKENRRTVSHYLIHITRHELGFRIMKSIMWGVGKTEAGRGGLALMQKSLAEGHVLFDPEWDAFKESILNELTAPRKAAYFYSELPGHPDNLFCEPAYREALLELEQDGSIIILDSNGKATTASTRRQRNGKPTLSEKHTITLRSHEQ
jgi:three-Cys-motif partner protein